METQLHDQINSNGHSLEEVERFIRIMHPGGQRFEIRAIDDGPPIPHFFDDPAAATGYIAGLTSRGIYVTLNPVADAIEGNGASDQDIPRRHWMLVDCDPDRKAGTNSSQEELDAALRVRDQVEAYLAEQGFPEPVRVMSGNGGHLLYRVDLEPETDLVKRVLMALDQKFSNDRVKIDRTVANASRITKVAGTLTKKGEDTPERPRRRAHLENPDISPELVSKELLEKVAAQIPNKKPPAAGGAAGGQRLERGVPLPVIQPIEERCAFMRHCRDDAENLSEPDWFAMSSIAGRCQGGRQLVHEWSSPHPNYTWEETERKIRHALEDGGPRTCESIQLDLGFEGCETCSHRGKITSPIQLGNIQPGQNYFVRDGGIWMIRGNDKPDLMLANFTARISKDIKIDDRTGVRRFFEISATVDGQNRVIEVPADKFEDMKWVTSSLGARAVLAAGRGFKDCTREAIQTLNSDLCIEEEAYGHTGWKNIDGGWKYLHSGGAIGSGGLEDDYRVLLDSPLDCYELKLPETAEDERNAIRASLGMLELGVDRIMFPLLCTTYRAVFGDAGLVVHLVGGSGAYKTETATLCQRHYGIGFHKKLLPGSWSSTANALEGSLFAAKDALFVIDDFKPKGSKYDVDRMHMYADQVIRNCVNGQSRARMRPDSSIRPDKRSETTLLCTGEDTPRGESLRGRMVILQVNPRDILKKELDRCQADARNGLYPLAIAGFVRWIAGDYEAVKTELHTREIELRDEMQREGHPRTPDNVASMIAGFELWLKYAKSVSAVCDSEADELLKHCRKAMDVVMSDQDQEIREYNPAERICELLASAVSCGQAYVGGADGGPPEQMHALGWDNDLNNINGVPRPCSKLCVGWYILGEFLIDSNAALIAIRRAASDEEGINLTKKSFARELHKGGKLASTELDISGTYTVRRTINGSRKRLLNLKPEVFGIDDHLVVRGRDDRPELDQDTAPVAGRIRPADRPA